MAKAFEEFDEFFKQSSKSAKAFVRGNTINPNASGESVWREGEEGREGGGGRGRGRGREGGKQEKRVK